MTSSLETMMSSLFKGKKPNLADNPRYDFKTAPVAKKEAIVQGENYRFTVLTEGLLRYEWAPDGKFEDRASTFAVKRELSVPKYFAYNDPEQVIISTNRFELRYDGQKFSRDGFVIRLKTEFPANATVEGTGYWQYGDEIADLGGTIRTLDTVEGRGSVGHGILSKTGFGVIDDSKSFLFRSDGWVDIRLPGDDRVDGYVFAYGHDYREAMRAFYAVSGSQPLLPRFALGNWWCRYHKYTDEEYLDVMDHYTRDQVPFAISIIDLFWHYVDNVPDGGSGWGGYNWNLELYPDPKGFLKALHDRGLVVTMNDHPSDGIRWFDLKYKEVAQVMGIDPATKKQIPFDSVNQKFFDAYFDIVHHQFEDEYGVDFWWVDWQQGEKSNLPGVDPLWMIDHYHFLDNSRKNKRPLILSRFAGPGSQRYVVGFSGDVVMTWPSLNFQPEFTATASNIGYGWWSHDIGGHMHGYKDDELTTRWYQLGTWSPIFRIHCDNNLFNFREPWKFNKESCTVMEESLRLRHRLIPYLYSMNARSAQYDDPLIQPIYWEYPDRDEAYKWKNSYYYGNQVLVCPITAPRDPDTHLGRTDLWLPPGRWVDIFAGLIYDGDKEIAVYRPLSQTPVFAKEGAIVPINGAQILENGVANPKIIELILVVGSDGHFELIEDDGTGSTVDEMGFDVLEPASPTVQEALLDGTTNKNKGGKDKDGNKKPPSDGKPGATTPVVFTTTNIKWENATGTLTVSSATPSSPSVPEARTWRLRLVSHTSTLAKNITASHSASDGSGQTTLTPTVSTTVAPPLRELPLHTASSTVIEIRDVPTSETLKVTIGVSPTLDVLDPAPRIYDIFYDSKGNYDRRQEAYLQIIATNLSVAEKIKRIREKDGLPDSSKGAVVEALGSDGRLGSGVRF